MEVLVRCNANNNNQTIRRGPTPTNCNGNKNK